MASIQGIYVALFGRPADPAGLAFFNEATQEGADLTAIGDLAATDEYQDRFDGQSNAQIINSIYLSLFNRPAEAAGLAFFANALATGELTINNIAIAILDGAQGADLDVVNTKIEAADLFTAAIDTDEEIALYQGAPAAEVGINFLAGVTTTVPSQAAVDAAVASLGDAQFPGNEIVLTTGDDNVVAPTNGTPGDLDSTPYNDTITEEAPGDWDANDEIDGGAGRDTLIATVAVNVAPGENLKNVEVLEITATAGATIDLTDVVGVEEVWNVESTGDLEFDVIEEGVTAGVRGDLGATNATFTYDNADEATVILDGATAASVVVAGADIVNVTVDGNAAIDTIASEAEELVVSGSGNLAGTGVATTITSGGNVLEVADFSGLDGKINIAIDASVTEDLTLTGTSSVDQIDITAAVGAVTLVYNTDEKSIYAVYESVTGFTAGAAGDVLDLSAFGLAEEDFVVFANDVNGSAYVDASVGLYYDGTDTYVFIDSNGNGTLDHATDTTIVLAGVDYTGTMTADNFIF